MSKELAKTYDPKGLEDRLYQKRDLLCVREFQANLEQSNYKLFKRTSNYQ